jgi:DNA-binding NarL/FixJ family response regulator
LDIFRKDPDKFDLVVTDYTMPDLTGINLAAELAKVRPSIPIILCTGHSSGVSPERTEEAEIKVLLMKPVSNREMAQAIRRVPDD